MRVMFALAVGAPLHALGADIRGVPAELQSRYFSGSSFECLDGNTKIPIDQVNDDFCDCPDGSDEPGTSACPKGLFTCRKSLLPSIPAKVLPSFQVDDGVCDCCDGADEAPSVGCKDTCAHDALEAKQDAAEQAHYWKEADALHERFAAGALGGRARFAKAVEPSMELAQKHFKAFNKLRAKAKKMAAKQKQPSPKQMRDIQQHYGAYQEARVALDQAQEGAMGDYGVDDVFLLLNDNCWYKHPVNEKQLKGGTSNRWMGPAACANPTRTRPCIIRPHPSMHP